MWSNWLSQVRLGESPESSPTSSTSPRFVMDCLVFLSSKSARGGLTLSAIMDRLMEEMASPNLACPLDLVSPWAGPNGAYTRFVKP